MKQFQEVKAVLSNSLTYYLVAVDMESNYSYVNKRYADIFNPLHGELLGKHYSVTIHPDDLDTCRVVSEMAFKNPKRVFPATLRKHDGEGGYIITRWEYKAIFDEFGAPAGIFCIGYDITELTQLSGELQQVKYSHSHLVRKHVANIIGLGKLIHSSTDVNDIQGAAKMIVDSTKELDAVIRELYK